MIDYEQGISKEISLGEKREILLSYFRKKATVLNKEKGYIHAPWVNLDIDPCLQGFAADLIVEHFRDIPIDRVAGIPMCGVPLAAVVAERVEGVRNIVPRKGRIYPSNFGKNVVITESTASFTTGEQGVTFVFPSLVGGLVEQGKNRLLLLDDFCAFGDTACAIIPTLKNLGLEVCYAAYVSKSFQGGLEKIRGLGVEAFSVITVENILQDNTLVIT